MSRQSARAIILNGDKLLAMHRNKFGQEYYTLIGGGVQLGEEIEAALRRELREETGMEVGAVRPVFTEDGGELYGKQYVYLCEYKGGEPVLAPDSEEGIISAMGKNLYEPVWLPVADLPKVVFRSASVRDAILAGLRGGFPAASVELAWKG